MEHLDLFTPVEELKADGKYFLVRNGSHVFTPYGKTWFDKEENKWYDEEGRVITHVLDLYKLTTKERASTCIEEATVETYENCTSYQDAENVSEKFKNLL